MTLRRYRCHAALCRGHVTAPALVTMHADGHVTVEPYTAEVCGTTDYNGAIVLAPPGTELPPALPPRGLTASLEALTIPPSDLRIIPYFIPIGQNP